MQDVDRRELLKLAGGGLGVVMASSFFADRLLAGTVAAGGAELLQGRFGVGLEDMKKVLATALSKGGDFADLFFEYRLSTSVTMEDEIVRQSSEDVTLGVGIRVLKGKQTGFAYTSDLTPERMRQAALTAAAIAATPGVVRLPEIREVRSDRKLYVMDRPCAEAPLPDKIALVREAYQAAKGHDPRVGKVQVTLLDELQYVVIANSEGLLVSDTRPQARFIVQATAEANGKRGTGRDNAGGRVGMAFYAQPGRTPREIGARASQEALLLLEAVDPAPGEQPVVLGSKNSGVMVHEAVGHPLEGDSNWRKTSIMWDKMGTMVASPLVTIYDDATIPYLRGTLDVDDEGTPTRNAVLIEKGKLVGFLHDRLSARILGAQPNGHGRRQSFQNVPIPRMGNTMLAPGQATPEDVIKSVKRGFYAHSFQGGQVEDTGKFTFSVNLGYVIEDGKLGRPVKNATLVGTNLQILQEVEMIANDTGLFLGNCGKDGQWAAVTAGTPTFKIRQMTVGGRA